MLNSHGNKSIEEDAILYVKKEKATIIEKVVGLTPPAKESVAIFMAGSPGAGKTEFSRHFLAKQFKPNSVVRIDPDEIREELPGYNGQNAYLFQGAVSLAVEKILDYVFHNNIHFLLDGTLSHLEVARKNVKRAIKNGRLVQVNYVYQPKQVAWEYTKAREKIMNRKITKEIFNRGFEDAKKVVTIIKKEFKEDVRVDLIIRNVKNNKYKYYFNVGIDEIKSVDKKGNLL